MLSHTDVRLILVQFELTGSVHEHEFPRGIHTSSESREEAAARKNRQRSDMRQTGCSHPVSAAFLGDRVRKVGLQLTVVRAQERIDPSGGQVHTIVTFTFRRPETASVLPRVSIDTERYLDGLSGRYWTKHYGFVSDDKARIHLRFEHEGVLLSDYSVGDENEWGIAPVTVLTPAREMSAQRMER